MSIAGAVLTRGGTLREWNGEPVAFVVVEKWWPGGGVGGWRYVGRRMPVEGPAAGGEPAELASAESMAECVKKVCARLGER